MHEAVEMWYVFLQRLLLCKTINLSAYGNPDNTLQDRVLRGLNRATYCLLREYVVAIRLPRLNPVM